MVDASDRRLLAAILLLSGLGGLVKIVGGVFYGSRALFVDALTSIANFVSIIATVYYYRKSLLPPDLDHHYGHHRLGFGGAFTTIMAYSFVAGLSVWELALIEPYTVSPLAPFFALLGLVFYAIAISLSRRAGEYFTPYAVFTVSELIESTTVIAASLLGSIYYYLIDYVGALIIVGYLFYELYDIARDFIKVMSDIAPEPGLVRDIKREIEDMGPRVMSIRLRMLRRNYYQGDIVIRVDPSMSVEEAHRIADEIERILRQKYNVDVIVHIEPCKDASWASGGQG